MKDIEAIDIVFKYMYKEGKCLNIIQCLYEETHTEINSEDSFRIFKLLLSTGLVERQNYSYGPNPAIMLNDDGYRIILQYGSYSAFLESKRKEKEKVSEERNVEYTNSLKDKKLDKKLQVLIFAAAVIGIIVAILIAILKR
jgi:hypothetical protein